MKEKLLFCMIFFSGLCTLFSQQTIVKGSVIEANSFTPVSGVTVIIENTSLTRQTNNSGEFEFSSNIPMGEQIIKISKEGFTTKRFPIVINEGGLVNITDMILDRDFSSAKDLFTITLTDDELNDDTNVSDNISGLLQSSLDIFHRTAAFEFSASFFSLRGLDSSNGTILINGIEMNDVFNGRPQWSYWGGINDALRNQDLSMGLAPSNYHFGGFLGTTNINVRASQARSGARMNYSNSNRSYTNRIMATYASGLLKNNWAFACSVGRRWGDEGFTDATFYNANSFFASAGKIINDKHSIHLSAIYTPNRRGKSSPNTQEVYDLKDIKYNEYWGWQNGKKRNSRIKDIAMPIFILNHDWNISSKTTLNINLAYQSGTISNSRLDYNGTDLINDFPQGGGANPSPTYYQKLPSYFERNYPNNLEFAYVALKNFQNNGQIDWDTMYLANVNNVQNGGHAVYALYDDVIANTQLSLGSVLNTHINKNIILNAALNYRGLKSENYAQVVDLLGASTFLDVDAFATEMDEAQNDLLHPNRIVKQGDIFKYHYNLNAQILSGFAQTQFNFNKTDFYISTQITSTQYQRDGLYKNGGFPNNCFGKGDKLSFLGLGFKGGLTYNISSKHFLDFNAGYVTKAPTLQNTFSNSRENHQIVPNISEEKTMAFDASYMFRNAFIKAKLTGYFISIKDANEISFFFADGIGGDNSAFVQEILQNVNKQHVGAEFGIEANLTSQLKLKGVAAIGQFIYNNNPNLLLSTEPDAEAEAAGFVNGYKDFGASYLKNYKLATGPQNAYSVGFEYNDPDFWWFGATANFFKNTYIDVSPLTRTSNFNTDFDGNVFNDYDAVLARQLLKQERFKDYMVVNLVGGKSWKLGEYYVGFFASINNLLNEIYKTGGFEQGRNANYRELRNDKALQTPVFGSKYWYGRGTTYFLNMNIRF